MNYQSPITPASLRALADFIEKGGTIPGFNAPTETPRKQPNKKTLIRESRQYGKIEMQKMVDRVVQKVMY